MDECKPLAAGTKVLTDGGLSDQFHMATAGEVEVGAYTRPPLTSTSAVCVTPYSPPKHTLITP